MREIKFNAQLKEKINRSMRAELYEIYNNGIDEFDGIEDLLSSDIKDTQKNSIRNYYVVRIISVLEAFLRNSFIILIDYYQRDFKITIQIDLDGLKELRNKQTEFTNGAIIANSLNFQRLERGIKGDSTIYRIFEQVLDDDIYARMARIAGFLQVYDTLIDVLKERHRIAHDIQGTVYTTEMLKGARDAFEKFIVMFSDVRNDIMNSWH